MLALGFGFVEAGTVTPRPQPGNPKPRLFRLEEDGGAINRMGFNSGGLDAVVARLSRHKRRGIVGVNLGKNRDSADAVADYEEGIRRTAGLADYLVVNISSPNTPGLRDLQARAALDSLLRRLIDTRSGLSRRVPLLLKIAPDLTTDERRDIAQVALDTGIDGLIISNTTIARPGGLRSRHADETGGLSGRPLFAASTALLSDMYRLTQGRLPLVGVGGVAGAADALAKIRAGASLVQLYTALIFEGPALVGRLKTDLAELLRREGFDWVGSAVGSAHPPTSTAAIRAAQTACLAALDCADLFPVKGDMRIDRLIERALFASRWLLAPIYLGLAVLLAIFAIRFFRELGEMIWHLPTSGETDVLLGALSLIDVALVAGLIVMVMLSGYENFVSRLDVSEAEKAISWLGKLDSGTLKLKVAAYIVAISAIQLLKGYMDITVIPNDKLLWMTVIHLTFVVSALLLTVMDRLMGAGHPRL